MALEEGLDYHVTRIEHFRIYTSLWFSKHCAMELYINNRKFVLKENPQLNNRIFPSSFPIKKNTLVSLVQRKLYHASAQSKPELENPKVSEVKLFTS
jgi:hypothetical protein